MGCGVKNGQLDFCRESEKILFFFNRGGENVPGSVTPSTFRRSDFYFFFGAGNKNNCNA